MAAAVARLDRAVSDIVAAHDGVRPVEQGEGDSFVVAFARASDAVACALEMWPSGQSLSISHAADSTDSTRRLRAPFTFRSPEQFTQPMHPTQSVQRTHPMQATHRVQAMHARHATHSRAATHITVNRLAMTPTLPAVAAEPATATLPAVATHPATATLPAVATHPATATLPAVATHPATATLPAVATDPATKTLSMLAIEPTTGPLSTATAESHGTAMGSSCQPRDHSRRMRSALPWAIFSRSPGLRVVRSKPSTASREDS